MMTTTSNVHHSRHSMSMPGTAMRR
jgi:hypothetical protein